MGRLNGLLGLGLCCMVGLAMGACRSQQKADGPAPANSQPAVVQPVSPAPSQVTPGPTPAPTAPVPATPAAVGTSISPPQAAQLIAAQPEARINLRSAPATTASTRGYGLVGDPVQLLRSTQAGDGLWYYVKFEQSGAEGWIRGDFINLAGRPQPLASRVAQGSQCKGVMESLAFTAYYDDTGFTLVRFLNLETRNSFDGSLTRQGNDPQGKPLYVGTASPPTGGSYGVQIIDLSGGKPGGGSQLTLNYNGMAGTALCP